MKKTDVVIIGAGPTGLFAGFYAGMRGLSTVIVDKLEIPGGQLAALYPEKFIYDVAGFPEVRAQELVNNLLSQLERFKDTTDFSLNNSVELITKNEDGTFLVNTTNEEILAKSIIVAGGNGAFAPRKLGLDNEDTFNNIHYFVNDLNKFKDRRVAIFGGGDSAVDWSLMLQGIASEVHIIHRRNEFRAHDHSIDELKKSATIIHTPFSPKELIGDDSIKTLVLSEAKTNLEKTIDVDDVICNFGFISNLGPIKNWDLELEGNKIKVNSDQQTNVDGIFAIGDICTYEGKAGLIISGFGEGPVAINGCCKYINPEAIIGALHSSHVLGGH